MRADKIRKLEHVRRLAAQSEQGKLDALNELAALDASEPGIQGLARSLWSIAENWCSPAETRKHFVQLAHAIARDCITYRTDVERVGREQIDGITDPYQPSTASLFRGVDDCDAKARVFVALCLAVRVPARVEGRFEAGRLTHVYASCEVDGKKKLIETIIARARLGEKASEIPVEVAGPRAGRWLYT